MMASGAVPPTPPKSFQHLTAIAMKTSRFKTRKRVTSSIERMTRSEGKATKTETSEKVTKTESFHVKRTKTRRKMNATITGNGVTNCLLFCLVFLVTVASGNKPVFDLSNNMRLLLLPADTKMGSVIYRLRASDADDDYPLKFSAFGKELILIIISKTAIFFSY